MKSDLDQELIDAFSRLGGKVCRDDEGRYWLFEAGDWILEVRRFVRRMSDSVRVGIEISFSNSVISEIVNQLRADGSTYEQQLGWKKWDRLVDVREALAPAFGDICSQALKEFQILTIETVINRFLELPSIGTRQIARLAVLAFRGDITTLTKYAEAFKQGDRCGFDQSITPEILDRAISVASERLFKNSE